MEKGVGSDGVEVEGFEGGFDLVVVFLLERWKLGWFLGKDVTPFGSDSVKYVDWVSDGLVMVDSSKAGGVFVFEVGKALVLILLKTVLPIIDAVVFLLLFVVLLYGEQCIDDGLALC